MKQVWMGKCICYQNGPIWPLACHPLFNQLTLPLLRILLCPSMSGTSLSSACAPFPDDTDKIQLMIVFTMFALVIIVINIVLI